MENVTSVTPDNSSFTMTEETSSIYITTAATTLTLDGPLPISINFIITYCVISPFLCVVGIFGNVLTLVIVRDQKKKTSSSCLVFSLALSDLLVLVARLSYDIYRNFQIFAPAQTVAFSRYIPSYGFLEITIYLRRVSKILLIPVVIERLIAIWFPLQVRSLCTTRKSMLFVGFLVVFASIFGIPNIVDCMITHLRVINEGGVVYKGQMATVLELARNYKYLSETMSFLFKINRVVFDFFPMIFVILANVAILIGLKDSIKVLEISNTQTDWSTARKKQTKQITRMLLSVTVTFVFLCLPDDIISVLVNYFNFRNIESYVYTTCNTFSTLNHAVNFLLYWALNSTYRQRYLAIVTCRKCRLVSTDLTESPHPVVSATVTTLNENVKDSSFRERF